MLPPARTRKKPISPQYSPQELRTIQCVLPLSEPQPTIETTWSTFAVADGSSNTPFL